MTRLAAPQHASIATGITASPGRVLQRKCACGGKASAGEKCDDCRKKRLQRKANGESEIDEVPRIVYDVLRSPGQPLDAATRAFMKPRFGHDFSHVRVHTDTHANRSAKAINAMAYTVGKNVVFDSGNYPPHDVDCLQLVAHELAHTVQQSHEDNSSDTYLSLGHPADACEREASQAADAVMSNAILPALTNGERTSRRLRRACGKSEIGEPTGCASLQGEVVGERFLYDLNCDVLKPVDRARLELFAETIVNGETIEIHGFASIEGDPDYNEHLSCARAILAQSIISAAITSRGITAKIAVFSHGATPGLDRPQQRCVVISRSGVVPVTPPVPPPPSPSPGKSYPFSVSYTDCDVAPYSKAVVSAAVRTAFDKVVNGNCVHSQSLKDQILSEFDGLNIDCEQGSDKPCGRASRYFTQTVNIYPPSLTPACGPLEATILHEVVHLTEWRLIGHGDLAGGCEKSCFGFGSGDATKCK